MFLPTGVGEIHVLSSYSLQRTGSLATEEHLILEQLLIYKQLRSNC